MPENRSSGGLLERTSKADDYLHHSEAPRSSRFQKNSGSTSVLFVRIAITLLIACTLLSYFVKPKAPIVELVSPEQELESFEAKYPGDTGLAHRVMSSYGLAMVLFQTPYTETNVGSLENLRSWAKEQFQAAPDFLHPVRVMPEKNPNDTVIGALGYNLFASIHYTAQYFVGEFLRGRIAAFHDTSAYQSFQSAYFDLFGKDAESATLLARYQSDKAKAAIEVVLWTATWFGYVGLSLFAIMLSARSRRFEHIRLALSGSWLLIGIAHAASAWMENSIPSAITSAFSYTAALYLFKPFVLRTRDDASLKVTFIRMSSRWIALSLWLTYSLIAITLLTWIRASLPESPDPITLLMQSLNGNFLHDPESGKGLAMRAIGITWLVVSLWAFMQRQKDSNIQDELDAELASL